MTPKDIRELKALIKSSNYPEEYKKIGVIKLRKMWNI